MIILKDQENMENDEAADLNKSVLNMSLVEPGMTPQMSYRAPKLD